VGKSKTIQTRLLKGDGLCPKGYRQGFDASYALAQPFSLGVGQLDFHGVLVFNAMSPNDLTA
jgi:hypothetical protein